MAKRNKETREKYKHFLWGHDDEAGPESADFRGIVLSREDWASARIYRRVLPAERFRFRKLGVYLRAGWSTRPGALRGPAEPFQWRRLGVYLARGWSTRPGALRGPVEPFQWRRLGVYLARGWSTRPGALPVRYAYTVEILDRHEGAFDRRLDAVRDFRDRVKFCGSCGGEMPITGGRRLVGDMLCPECLADLVEVGDCESDDE